MKQRAKLEETSKVANPFIEKKEKSFIEEEIIIGLLG